jgi:hypothetical protein
MFGEVQSDQKQWGASRFAKDAGSAELSEPKAREGGGAELHFAFAASARFTRPELLQCEQNLQSTQVCNETSKTRGKTIYSEERGREWGNA